MMKLRNCVGLFGDFIIRQVQRIQQFYSIQLLLR